MIRMLMHRLMFTMMLIRVGLELVFFCPVIHQPESFYNPASQKEFRDIGLFHQRFLEVIEDAEHDSNQRGYDILLLRRNSVFWQENQSWVSNPPTFVKSAKLFLSLSSETPGRKKNANS